MKQTLCWLGLIVFLTGCQVVQGASGGQNAAATLTPSPLYLPYILAPPGGFRFAVIGDYGYAGQPEADVATLVDNWRSELIITVGDNNYLFGEATTIDTNIGQYYANYIYPYVGTYPSSATSNRFFPSLGNHDWYTAGAQPYLDYFTLPGNERYYDFIWGPVHFFALDSDLNEPDGITFDSIQGQWLQTGLANANSPWKLVYTHFPPYSSAVHGSHPDIQWPFAAWGATAVLAGHDHTYERLLVDGLPYFVNGLGGRSLYGFGEPLPESIIRYNADYGAMLVEATETWITFYFVTRTGELIDSYTITASGNGVATFP